MKRRRVDGMVLIDKPPRMSSNAALQRIKRAYRALKAGHTGTLDPLATGLLPICLGEATKFSQGLLDSDKEYLTQIRLGVATETGDAEGRILRERPVGSSRADIDRTLVRFRGLIEQVPHRYSALKRAGRRLYEYARAGESVLVAPRLVQIHELEVQAWQSPFLALRVRCSKGTYIRSLAEDIGEALGCGGHVAVLRRTATGPLKVADALTIEALEAMSDAEREARILPVSSLIEDLPAVTLSAESALRFTHGLAVAADAAEIAIRGENHLIAVFGAPHGIASGNGFLGVGRQESGSAGRLIVPVRLLRTEAG